MKLINKSLLLFLVLLSQNLSALLSKKTTEIKEDLIKELDQIEGISDRQIAKFKNYKFLKNKNMLTPEKSDQIQKNYKADHKNLTDLLNRLQKFVEETGSKDLPKFLNELRYFSNALSSSLLECISDVGQKGLYGNFVDPIDACGIKLKNKIVPKIKADLEKLKNKVMAVKTYGFTGTKSAQELIVLTIEKLKSYADNILENLSTSQPVP